MTSLSNPVENGNLRQAQLKMLSMLKFVDAVCNKYGLDYWLEGGTLLGAVRHQGFIKWDDDLDITMPRESFEAFLKLAPAELPDNMWLQTAKTDKGYFNLFVPLKIRDNNSRYIVRREVGVEPYHQGIYIDIFPYDKRPVNPIKRTLYKFISKKTLRLLYHKYAPVYLYPGHNGRVYRLLSQMIPKTLLEKLLSGIIRDANKENSPYLGYGYDCINNNWFHYDDFYPLKRAKFEDGEFNIPNNADRILKRQFGDYWQMPPKHKRGMKHCRELIAHIEDI
ncbi:LicD family protein [Legionella sp. CNM-1927-20]|uniref:LicD family protein n=1 Tax=Legionella sp. CNM-1927-20 TaxID=3422221 RepID=UPI00403AC2BA